MYLNNHKNYFFIYKKDSKSKSKENTFLLLDTLGKNKNKNNLSNISPQGVHTNNYQDNIKSNNLLVNKFNNNNNPNKTNKNNYLERNSNSRASTVKEKLSMSFNKDSSKSMSLFLDNSENQLKVNIHNIKLV